MLVVLIALGGMAQHGQSAEMADTAGHRMVAAMAAPVTAAPHEHDKWHKAHETRMSDACAILCLGTPAPWITAAQIVPGDTGRHLKWRLAAVTHAGRPVGPGYRPPKSI
ncbi:MAG: hypothetical protein ACK5IP_13900 [Paracoccus sp. (in: a-proteobacteria)]